MFSVGILKNTASFIELQIKQDYTVGPTVKHEVLAGNRRLSEAKYRMVSESICLYFIV
jgi:hypothetical protein